MYCNFINFIDACQRRMDNLKRLAAFLGLNFLLSLAISSVYLFFTGGHPAELGYAAAAVVSNTATIYLAAGLVCLPLFLSGPGRAAAAALLWFLQLFLVTDAAIYKIFKFHLNSMVLNLVLTPGGLESLDQGWGTKALFALIAGLLALGQWRLLLLSARLAPAVTGRRLRLAAAGLLLFIAVDKGLSAWGILYDKVYITRNAQLLPFYQPLRMRSFAAKHFGVKLDNEVKAGIDTRYSALAYPASPLRGEKPARPLNFLVIVVDSLRADMLTPEIMPETSRLGAKGLVFGNHYSGGNCTRFGIFSLLYGLYGNYWFPMLGERRGPVLIEELKRQGYDLKIYASAKLSFPEFNKTCFVEVPREDIYDEPAGRDGIERDADISAKFISYLEKRRPGRPYFSFLFYDASHGSYDALPGLEKFQPAEAIGQLAVNKGNVGRLFNRYKNSIHSDDLLVGRIMRALEKSGGLRDTVVIVTGDHGEAFLERGRYGHNQAYTPEELRVPLVFYMPGGRPGRVDEPTSHLDVAPELLRLAGVKNPASDYSHGRPLLDRGPRNFLPAGSWDTAALVKDGYTVEMPLEAYRGAVKVYDREYREEPGAARRFAPEIAAFQKEARRFYR
jgi:uncharacterized protein